MKKFISIISLLLVTAMIFAVPVFADEAEESKPFEPPKGMTTYYANNVSGNTPNIDGVIGEGEYGELTVRVTDPTPFVDAGGDYMENPKEHLKSEYIDFWFAYDENNVYIAIHDPGPKYKDNGDEFKLNDVPFRYNYHFSMDFTPEDLTDYFRFGGGNTVTVWNAQMQYFEFGKSNRAPIKVSDWVTECIVRKVDKSTGADIAFGDLITTTGNPNFATGEWEMYMELKLDKKAVAKALNDCYFTDYDTIPNGMYFSFGTNGFQAIGTYKADGKTENLEPNDTQYYRWLGANIIRDNNGDYEEFGLYEGGKVNTIGDLIIFGDENTVFEPADPFPVRETTEAPTEAPTTEPEVTDAPADETEVPAGETEAPADEGGCGGTVAVAGIALVAALGTCTAFVAKKKED
ncbi:MAG: hypothetical protein IKB02_00060 [Clostridia bacterium]|nr:hypothetical protein [Clostridia bacterium]